MHAGKDMFEAHYKNFLAKRLIVHRAVSEEAERLVLMRLKQECGSAYTSKLEAMFKDITVSVDLLDAYTKVLVLFFFGPLLLNSISPISSNFLLWTVCYRACSCEQRPRFERVRVDCIAVACLSGPRVCAPACRGGYPEFFYHVLPLVARKPALKLGTHAGYVCIGGTLSARAKTTAALGPAGACNAPFQR